MAALPALVGSYSTRANIPCANNATTTTVSNWYIWSIYAALTDAHANGSLSTANTRAAASIWTVVGSCDGSGGAGSFGASDKWGTTFDTTKLVRAASGSNHSWMHLRNAGMGIDCVIDCNSATVTTFRLSWGYTGTYGSGTATAGPVSTDGWLTGTTAVDAASTSVVLIADTTALATHYFHFTCSATYFFFAGTRAGTALFHMANGLVKTTGGNSSDQKYNIFALGGVATSGGEGTPSAAQMRASSGCVGRTNLNTQTTNQGASSASGAGTFLGDSASVGDGITSESYYFPLNVWNVSTSTVLTYRGTLIDTYEAVGSAVGTSHPSVSGQRWIQIGSILVPFLEYVPLF